MTIGQRIKNRRLELGLTQEELAKRLGNKTRASVCTVEKDKEDLTTTRIRQYADALETTPAYLMGWEDKENQEFINAVADIYVQQDNDRALLEMYHNVPPEVRTMVDYLLKSAQLDSEDPD